MAITSRGQHPDLADEETVLPSTAPSPSPPPSEPPFESGAERAPAGSAPEESSPSAEPAAADASAPPDWMEQVRAAKDPTEAFRVLAKNLPRDELAKDEVISGLVGSRADQRARELLVQQQHEGTEKRKRDAAQKGDLYALGELAAPEVLQRMQADAHMASSAPFMDGVSRFQQRLPQEVQAQVAGRDWPGNTVAEQVDAYLSAVVTAMVDHGQAAAVEKEIKKREPTLRKAWLSEANGEAPVPELEGGRAPTGREITDEQIGRMSNAEFDQYFDERGQPRPGVRVRYTRAIPLTRH